MFFKHLNRKCPVIMVVLFLPFIISLNDVNAKAEIKNELFPVRINEKRGYLDKTGKIIIQPQFDDAYDFSDGLARVKIDKKIGYIDKNGTMIIQPQFDKAYDFSNSMAQVEVNEKIGYIDRTGKVVIKPQFDKAYDFSEGLARVRVDKKIGYIDKNGTMIIQPQFDKAYDFSDGLAYVEADTKKVFINTTGEVVINVPFHMISSFSEGLACVRLNGNYGYIDRNGAIVIAIKFEQAQSFSEGLAAVLVDEKWGYIDNKGNMLIKPQFDYAQSFSEGLAAVRINKKFGYIDKNGTMVIKPEFDGALDFKGLAYVTVGKKLIYIDSTGKHIYEYAKSGPVDAKKDQPLPLENIDIPTIKVDPKIWKNSIIWTGLENNFFSPPTEFNIIGTADGRGGWKSIKKIQARNQYLIPKPNLNGDIAVFCFSIIAFSDSDPEAEMPVRDNGNFIDCKKLSVKLDNEGRNSFAFRLGATKHLFDGLAIRPDGNLVGSYLYRTNKGYSSSIRIPKGWRVTSKLKPNTEVLLFEIVKYKNNYAVRFVP